MYPKHLYNSLIYKHWAIQTTSQELRPGILRYIDHLYLDMHFPEESQQNIGLYQK